MSSALEFLRERRGFLDGVVMSGGECTLYPALVPFIQSIKELGYLVKVDTNGSRPDVIRRLVDDALIDYIALDYKSIREHFPEVTGRRMEYESFSETLDYLIGKQFDFEVRTTVHPEIVDEMQVNMIAADLRNRGYHGIYYLQHYFHTEKNMGGMKEPKRKFDLSLLDVEIPVELRNFPEGAFISGDKKKEEVVLCGNESIEIPE